MRAAITTALLLCLASLCACTDPHAPPSFQRLDCEACHGGEFDRVVAHEIEGAPRECYRCHGTTGWFPIVPNRDGGRRHPWFEIQRGAHAGWDCWQCHVDGDPEDEYNEPTDDFTCIGCHEHSEGRTTPHHGGMDEYEYAPKSCYRCHRHAGGGD